MISAAMTKLSITTRVASVVISNERKDIIFTLSDLECVMVLRTARKIMLSAKMTARSLNNITIMYPILIWQFEKTLIKLGGTLNKR